MKQCRLQILKLHANTAEHTPLEVPPILIGLSEITRLLHKFSRRKIFLAINKRHRFHRDTTGR